tara:strand:+ start:455 stop:1153 length:699 start_codon:yes stop_codon:yes gene_type:complete
MKGRPEYISREDFRGGRSPSQLNKLFVVDNILPSSYILRYERNGVPMKTYRGIEGQYRAIDIITRAWGRNQCVTPPKTRVVQEKIDVLQARYNELYAQYQHLERVHTEESHTLKLNEFSRYLTGRTLLTEQEVCDAAVGFEASTGVYFLVAGDEVVYVGQSVSVGSRIRSHMEAKEFDRWAYIPCDAGILDQLESLYIHTLRPRYNGRSNDIHNVTAPVRLDTLLRLGGDRP